MHKFSFALETISDERRNAFMQGIIDLIGQTMAGVDKATISYQTEMKAGRWKEKVAKTITWEAGQDQPELREFNIFHTQLDMFTLVAKPITTTPEAERDHENDLLDRFRQAADEAAGIDDDDEGE